MLVKSPMGTEIIRCVSSALLSVRFLHGDVQYGPTEKGSVDLPNHLSI